MCVRKCASKCMSDINASTSTLSAFIMGACQPVQLAAMFYYVSMTTCSISPCLPSLVLVKNGIKHMSGWPEPYIHTM